MSRASHTVRVQAEIPEDITPDQVISALHYHLNVITLQPLVVNVVPVPKAEVRGLYFGRTEEEHFGENAAELLDHYVVTERVVVVPGIGSLGKKEITFPARFLNTKSGLKSWADAPQGITVRGDWTIKPMEWQRDRWVLEELATVECSFILMPFVKKSFDAAHANICRNLVAKVKSQAKEANVQPNQPVPVHGAAQVPEGVMELPA